MCGGYKPMFAAMILDPIWQLYDAAVVCGDPERAAKMATKVGTVVVITKYMCVYVTVYIVCMIFVPQAACVHVCTIHLHRYHSYRSLTVIFCTPVIIMTLPDRCGSTPSRDQPSGPSVYCTGYIQALAFSLGCDIAYGCQVTLYMHVYRICIYT